MNFSDYQKESRVTAIYPEQGDNFIYPALGLVGESGEVADKIKKLIRDKGISKPSQVDETIKKEIIKELGDVLWYVSQLATEFKVKLEDVAEQNIIKLRDRSERGKLTGSGDNR